MIPQKQDVLILFDVVLNHAQKAHAYNMQCASYKNGVCFHQAYNMQVSNKKLV